MSRRYKVTMPANDKLNAFQEGVLFKNGQAIVDESTINKNLKLRSGCVEPGSGWVCLRAGL